MPSTSSMNATTSSPSSMNASTATTGIRNTDYEHLKALIQHGTLDQKIHAAANKGRGTPKALQGIGKFGRFVWDDVPTRKQRLADAAVDAVRATAAGAARVAAANAASASRAARVEAANATKAANATSAAPHPIPSFKGFVICDCSEASEPAILFGDLSTMDPKLRTRMKTLVRNGDNKFEHLIEGEGEGLAGIVDDDDESVDGEEQEERFFAWVHDHAIPFEARMTADIIGVISIAAA